jgi:hypothetical protein
MPLPSAGFLNVEVVSSYMTIPNYVYYIKWCHNVGHYFLALGLKVGYEIQAVEAGRGWLLDFFGMG